MEYVVFYKSTWVLVIEHYTSDISTRLKSLGIVYMVVSDYITSLKD